MIVEQYNSMLFALGVSQNDKRYPLLINAIGTIYERQKQKPYIKSVMQRYRGNEECMVDSVPAVIEIYALTTHYKVKNLALDYMDELCDRNKKNKNEIMEKIIEYRQECILLWHENVQSLNVSGAGDKNDQQNVISTLAKAVLGIYSLDELQGLMGMTKTKKRQMALPFPGDAGKLVVGN